MQETFKIIGIDPGNNLGMCIMEIEVDTFKIVGIRTEFYCIENTIDPSSPDKQLTKLLSLINIVDATYNLYSPVCVGIEAAFMNIRFPKAVMQLSQYVGTIKNRFLMNNRFIKLFTYAPKMVKAIMGSGDNKKEDMLTDVIKIDEITNIGLDLSVLTEHEIDALCIAYCVLQDVRKYPLVTVCL